ncbi:MAG: hypothetical protein GF309_12010 [Candidatus Lokiarchaeota archaeon]|nr:hypothetical protein [Candidatus Lokiarchaeota archaeon]
MTSNVQKYEPGTWKAKHLVQCLVETVFPAGIGLVDVDAPTFVQILKEQIHKICKRT